MGKATPGQGIVFGGLTFTPLFPDLIRSLKSREFHRLRDSIRAAGRVYVAVVADEDHGIIDGLNRLSIAAELGLPRMPCP